MNKIIAMAVAAATVVSFSACNQEKAVQEPAVTPAEAPAPAPVATPVASVFQKYVLPADIAAGGHCFLDAINGGQKEGASGKVGQDVSFGGWVSDARNQVPTTALFVIENEAGAYAVPMTAGAERPDVAAALANEALNNSGYNAVGKLEGVPAGDYKLGIVLEGAAPARCELNAKLLVTN